MCTAMLYYTNHGHAGRTPTRITASAVLQYLAILRLRLAVPSQHTGEGPLSPHSAQVRSTLTTTAVHRSSAAAALHCMRCGMPRSPRRHPFHKGVMCSSAPRARALNAAHAQAASLLWQAGSHGESEGCNLLLPPGQSRPVLLLRQSSDCPVDLQPCFSTTPCQATLHKTSPAAVHVCPSTTCRCW
jgi:hypothetical protein